MNEEEKQLSNQWTAGPGELSGDRWNADDVEPRDRPRYLLCVAVGGPIHGQTRAVHEGDEYTVKREGVKYRYAICPDPEDSRAGKLVLIENDDV